MGLRFGAPRFSWKLSHLLPCVASERPQNNLGSFSLPLRARINVDFGTKNTISMYKFERLYIPYECKKELEYYHPYPGSTWCSTGTPGAQGDNSDEWCRDSIKALPRTSK